MAYTPRLTAPSTTDSNWIHSSYGGKNDCMRISGSSVLPNCVGYAWGRFMELLGSKPRLSRANAEDWFSYNDGYARGNTPKLGAVICWAKGVAGNPIDGAGHVAIVEQINANNSIVTSNSAYGGTRFYTSTIGSSYGVNGYTFQGFIYNPAATNEQPASTGWVSLNGISFRINVPSVVELDLKVPTFTNGWTGYGGGCETAGYYFDRDRVYLRGLIKGTAISTSAFTLPIGYRPPLAVYGMGVSNNAPCVVRITADGNVYIVTGTATGWVNLNGISFRITDSVSSVQTPVFTNGWSAYGGGCETAGYYFDRDRVYLKGMIKGTTLHSSVFTLPAEYRPPFTVYGMGVSNDAPCVVRITAGGNVIVETGTT